MSCDPATRPPSAPRWPLGIALALVVALVVGVLIAAAVARNQSPDPLRLVALPAPSATSTDCARLLGALPATLDGGQMGGLPRRQLAAPAPAGAAGWGQPPVVLRCGLARPAELTPTSRLLDVSGVQFLEIPAPETGRETGRETNSWVAVDRPVYVAVALPPASGSGPLQQLATVIGNTLPQRDVDVSS
ncbi:MAG: DUF3515 domain-containing protein [Pseudonocardiales bacterium]|nr:DUF3515 domain-containing protein [Pseudonocardiales bacterium]